MGREFLGASVTRRAMAVGDSLTSQSAVKEELPPNVHLHWPLYISKALTEHCQIHHKAFALLIDDGRGNLVKFTSPTIEPYQTVIFTPTVCEDFARAIRQAEHNGNFEHLDHEEVPQNGLVADDLDPPAPHFSSKPMQSDQNGGSKSSLSAKKRSELKTGDQRRLAKRRKSRVREYELSPSPESDDASKSTALPMIGSVDVLPYKQLRIGDTEAVNDFYKIRFQDLQQLYCKIVAKAWIKKIEPRKQTTHPYKDGNSAAPDWWPKGVDHREPDHIKKDPRVSLLLAIIRAKRTSIAELENSTNAVLNSIAVEKRPILADIYRVAKAEERYFDGCLGPDTVVHVPSKGLSISSEPETPSARSSISPTRNDQTQPDGGQGGLSTLASPVGHLQLHTSPPGPTREDGKSEELAHDGGMNFPDARRQQADEQRSLQGHAGYQAQYMHPSPVQEPTTYMDHQTIHISGQFPFSHRNNFGAPSGTAEFSRKPYHEAVPSNMYGWPTPPSFNTAGPLYGGFTPASPNPVSQTSGSMFQLPPPSNVGTALPPFHGQPGSSPPPVISSFPSSGIQPRNQFEMPPVSGPLRNGSIGQSHHLPQPGFSDFLHEDLGHARDFSAVGNPEHSNPLMDGDRHDSIRSAH